MKLTFSKQAQQAFDCIQDTDTNVFVTGKAGTGKSTLLEYIRDYCTKKLVILAPTGISAINVHGDTIHSFFKLKPGFEKEEAEEMRIDEKKQKKYKKLKAIAIDEISMVRADLLDAVDIVLRRARKSSLPFGGVQMIFFGDLYQLPPVVTPVDREKYFSEYASPYFFDAKVFGGQGDLFSGGFNLKIIELTDIYRQKDTAFINVLNAVRNKSVTQEHLETLNARHLPDFVPKKNEKYIYLMTTNANAAAINSAELEKLRTEDVTFSAEKTGEIARNLYPNDEDVTIGVGAQVMFVCNDAERRWVNGTIGKVVKIKDGTKDEDRDNEFVLVVEKNDGTRVEVKKHQWEISRYIFNQGNFEREVIGSFKQMPLKLAWAITIHKSQGKTFEKVIIDLGRGSFAHGQTYVALSRCTSLEGLVLKKPLTHSSIIMDERVKKFGEGE